MRCESLDNLVGGVVEEDGSGNKHRAKVETRRRRRRIEAMAFRKFTVLFFSLVQNAMDNMFK